MNIYYKITLMFALALSLSACNVSKDMVKQPKSDIVKEDQQAIADMSPTPTISQDNSLDGIEADLKSTTILEEDFSDIQ